MNRHIAEDTLIAYVLEEVEETDRREVSSHLSGCDTCRGVAARLSSAVDAYASPGEPEAPPEILFDLLEAQAETRDRRRSGWGFLRPILTPAAVAVVAVIFLSGFWAGRSSVPDAGIATLASQERTAIPQPLPDPPEIGFRAEPPLEIHFASRPSRWHPSVDSARDSL